VLGLVILLVVSTIGAVVRSVFVTRREKIDGDPVDPASYPHLRALLEETAAAIGTRPVDLVYLTPGTALAVIERRGERVLILGVGLFDGMKQHELRALLAHEYGHFRDAATGGTGVLSVRRSLSALIAGMARSRLPNVLNPAWWFVRAFTHLYLVVSTGASRLQEILADRWAIRAYGSAAFAAGARHVVTREVEFAQDLAQTINDVVENKWSLPNLYAYDPGRDRSSAAAAVTKKLDREPGRFDSHPSWRQRIQSAEQVALPGEAACPDGDAPVWSLFPEPERIERTMTAIIRARIRAKLGVTVSDAEWEDDEPVAS
jgi:Zn-dependent protease with chaperone function